MADRWQSRNATMKEYIRLEPRKEFDKAIVRKSKDGCLTYNYFLLIEVCMEMNDWDDEEAADWVEYNIVGLAINGFKISYAEPR